MKKNQFLDIVLQENNVNKEYIENIELLYKYLSEIPKKREFLLGKDDQLTWYGRLLFLGIDEGYPSFTFTAKWDEISKCGP